MAKLGAVGRSPVAAFAIPAEPLTMATAAPASPAGLSRHAMKAAYIGSMLVSGAACTMATVGGASRTRQWDAAGPRSRAASARPLRHCTAKSSIRVRRLLTSGATYPRVKPRVSRLAANSRTTPCANAAQVLGGPSSHGYMVRVSSCTTSRARTMLP